jgi:hypothetical protein
MGFRRDTTPPGMGAKTGGSARAPKPPARFSRQKFWVWGGLTERLPHKTNEARAIVSNLIALVEGQHADFVAALFRSIWGGEPGRLRYLNRPSFYGEILCCWRPRWIAGSEGSPMNAYAWYVWRKKPHSGPSFKVRVGKHEGRH